MKDFYYRKDVINGHTVCFGDGKMAFGNMTMKEAQIIIAALNNLILIASDDCPASPQTIAEMFLSDLEALKR